MTLHVWISFVAASVVLLLIPGPTVLQCIGDALANSRKQSWSTILGVGVGDTISMSLSLLGAGTLLKTSAAAFTVMKTIGGVYLLYLGIRAMAATRSGGGIASDVAVNATRESAFVRFSKASTVTMFNPKGILFFVAFVPQFISARSSFAPQASLLLFTFVTLAMINVWSYMSLAGFLSNRLQTKSAQKKVGYATGGALLAAGTLTLALKRR
jgi:threonine/homoserine/homoserine lactone efflux protein